MINCGKALAANATVLAIEKVVDHSIHQVLGEDPNKISMKPSFCVGILHGLPLQVALLILQGDEECVEVDINTGEVSLLHVSN